MACSVAPALPDEMFRQAGTAPHQMMSKARHRRTSVVFAGTDDEVAEVLRPIVPDSTCLNAPPEETTRLTDLDWIGYLDAGKARHRRTAAVFAGTDDEVAEVLCRPIVGALEEDTIVAAPVEPWFPTGVLGGPPESFVSSGPEMTAAFLASLVAAGEGTSDTTTDRELLVARWTERKQACARRSSYLRDYCPFQREEKEADEESVPETTTPPPEEPDDAEEAEAPPRVKTGLAFDSPESEAEFVKAIRSRYCRV
ncbi:unnamed protein product [Urochloa humidicola]